MKGGSFVSDIIEEILEAREDEGKLDIESEELKSKEMFRRKKSEELHNFINKRVHPRSRNTLTNLIERYVDAYCAYSDCEVKLYYKAGFSDAMNIILTSLRKKCSINIRNFCNRLLNKYKDLCKIDKLHPHLLRAYFCTNALHNAGYTIDQVANQAGHSSLNTTKGYLVTSQEDLVSLANKL